MTAADETRAALRDVTKILSDRIAALETQQADLSAIAIELRTMNGHLDTIGGRLNWIAEVLEHGR